MNSAARRIAAAWLRQAVSFKEWTESRRFRSPATSRNILFTSLPKQERERLRDRWHTGVQEQEQENTPQPGKVKDPLFHTTSYANLEQIAEQGLVPRSGGGTFDHGGYAEHSQGKVFLNDNPEGARSWKDKVFQQLEDRHGDENEEVGRRIPVMLRVKTRDTERDPVGDPDVSGSRFTTKGVPPEDLEFWHPEKKRWTSVSEWENASTELGVDERDEYGTHIKDEAFMPQEDDAYDRDDAAVIRKEKADQARQQEKERQRKDQESAAQRKKENDARYLEPDARQKWIDKIKERGVISPIPGAGTKPGVFDRMWQHRLKVDERGNSLPSHPFKKKSAEVPDFWTWMEKYHPKVPNPNAEGRMKEITPSTLKGYALGDAAYSNRAQTQVRQYLNQYQKLRKDVKAPEKRQGPGLEDTGKETWQGGKIYHADVEQDTFVHFTPQSRAKQILESGKLLADPPYKKFGIKGVQAISLGYGESVPQTQTTHIKGVSEKDPLVAVIFQTSTTPKSGYSEEVVWSEDVDLRGGRIVSGDDALKMLEEVPHKITEDDMVTYGDQKQKKGSQLRLARYNSEFLKWVEGQRFRHPKTRNRVLFLSLPPKDRAILFKRWKKVNQGEGAKKRQKANKWLATNEDPKRYDHVKFDFLDPETAENDRKRLATIFGTEDQKEIQNQILDLAGAGGIARLVESVRMYTWHSEYEFQIMITGRGKDDLHFERTLNYDDSGDEEHPWAPSHIANQYFSVGSDAPEGVGTRMLASQVGAAEQGGFMSIQAEAARSEGMNGYFTWPRLGFNAAFTEEDMGDLEDADPEAAWEVQQLAEADMDRNTLFEDAPAEIFHVMAVPAARKWWEKEGHTLKEASFSVSDDFDGGKSYQLLRAYTEAKAMAEGQTIPEYVSKIGSKKPNMAPRLTKQDDEILDQVWAEVRHRLLANVKKKKTAAIADFWLRAKIVKSMLRT